MNLGAHDLSSPHRTRRSRSRSVAAATVLLSLVVPSAACAAERAPARAATVATSASPTGVGDRLAALEARRGARLGVYALDTGTGAEITYRADERFAYASTIKALAAGAVLQDLTRRELGQRVHFTEEDLVEYSPVTELHVDDGLTVRQVIDAAITVSDNTAGNLLVDLLGGTAALDAALEEDTGDETTEVVRREPDLNSAVPGDDRDTSTPRALARSLGGYVLGDVLPPSDRRLLERTLRRTTTGDALIRAGVPRGWRVGDKTGSAAYGTRNDVAVVRPPGRAPVLLAVLTTHDDPAATTDDALVAAATRVVVAALRQRS